MSRSTTSLLLTLLLLVLAVPPASAQSDEDSEDEDGITSLTVGYITTDFDYIPPVQGFGSPYDFSKNLRGLMLSTRHGSLMLDYGKFEDDGTSRRTIGAELLTGGNAYLFREFFDLPIGVYVPIRFNLDYRYVQPDVSERNNLHLGAAGVGAGAGARIRLPVGPDFLEENFEARVTGVFVPGIMSGLSDIETPDTNDPGEDLINDDSFNDTRLRRMFNFNVEARLAEVLGDNVGITAGYTFRLYGRSESSPDSVGAFIDNVMLTGTYPRTNLQNVVRLGINW